MLDENEVHRTKQSFVARVRGVHEKIMAARQYIARHPGVYMVPSIKNIKKKLRVDDTRHTLR